MVSNATESSQKAAGMKRGRLPEGTAHFRRTIPVSVDEMSGEFFNMDVSEDPAWDADETSEIDQVPALPPPTRNKGKGKAKPTKKVDTQPMGIATFDEQALEDVTEMPTGPARDKRALAAAQLRTAELEDEVKRYKALAAANATRSRGSSARTAAVGQASTTVSHATSRSTHQASVSSTAATPFSASRGSSTAPGPGGAPPPGGPGAAVAQNAALVDPALLGRIYAATMCPWMSTGVPQKVDPTALERSSPMAKDRMVSRLSKKDALDADILTVLADWGGARLQGDELQDPDFCRVFVKAVQGFRSTSIHTATTHFVDIFKGSGTGLETADLDPEQCGANTIMNELLDWAPGLPLRDEELQPGQPWTICMAPFLFPVGKDASMAELLKAPYFPNIIRICLFGVTSLRSGKTPAANTTANIMGLSKIYPAMLAFAIVAIRYLLCWDPSFKEVGQISKFKYLEEFLAWKDFFIQSWDDPDCVKLVEWFHSMVFLGIDPDAQTVAPPTVRPRNPKMAAMAAALQQRNFEYVYDGGEDAMSESSSKDFDALAQPQALTSQSSFLSRLPSPRSQRTLSSHTPLPRTTPFTAPAASYAPPLSSDVFLSPLPSETGGIAGVVGRTTKPKPKPRPKACDATPYIPSTSTPDPTHIHPSRSDPEHASHRDLQPTGVPHLSSQQFVTQRANTSMTAGSQDSLRGNAQQRSHFTGQTALTQAWSPPPAEHGRAADILDHEQRRPATQHDSQSYHVNSVPLHAASFLAHVSAAPSSTPYAAMPGPQQQHGHGFPVIPTPYTPSPAARQHGLPPVRLLSPLEAAAVHPAHANAQVASRAEHPISVFAALPTAGAPVSTRYSTIQSAHQDHGYTDGVLHAPTATSARFSSNAHEDIITDHAAQQQEEMLAAAADGALDDVYEGEVVPAAKSTRGRKKATGGAVKRGAGTGGVRRGRSAGAPQ